MITKVIIKNFKSIKNLEIELAPLTILIGPNGSGKTSILEAIALMSQASSVRSDVIYPQVSKGSLVSFEDADTIFCKQDMEKWLCLGFKADIGIEEANEIKESVFSDKEAIPSNEKSNIRQFLSSLENQDIGEIGYIYEIKGDATDNRKISYSVNDIWFGSKQENGNVESFPEGIQLSPGRWTFLEPIPNWQYTDENSKLIASRASLFDGLSKTLRDKLGSIYYLTSERGFIPWYKTTERVKYEYVGRSGEHTLDIFSKLMMPKYDDKRSPYELLSEMFGVKRVWSGLGERGYVNLKL